MVRTTLCLIALVALGFDARAQQTQTGSTRADAQAALVAAVVDSLHQAGRTVDATPEGVRRFLRAFTSEWQARHPGASAVDQRLDPWAARLATGLALGSRQTVAANCAAWAEFRAPSYAADVRDISEADELSPLAGVLTAASFRAALDQAVFCDRPEGWAEIGDALRRTPQLARRLADVDSSARALRAEALALVPVVGLLDSLYVERPVLEASLAEAFDRSLGASRGPMVVAQTGYRSAVLHAARRDTASALRLLDVVAARTTPGDLRRDVLRAWYAALGGAAGVARWEAATSDSLWLVPDGDPVLVSGSVVAQGGLSSTEEWRGRYVLLDFWSAGCPIHAGHVPTVNALAAAYRDGLAVVGVTSDVALGWSEAEVEAAAHDHAMRYPSLRDDSQTHMRAFGVTAWPTYVLLGPDGRRLVDARTGRGEVSLSEVAAFLATVANAPHSDTR